MKLENRLDGRDLPGIDVIKLAIRANATLPEQTVVLQDAGLLGEAAELCVIKSLDGICTVKAGLILRYDTLCSVEETVKQLPRIRRFVDLPEELSPCRNN